MCNKRAWRQLRRQRERLRGRFGPGQDLSFHEPWRLLYETLSFSDKRERATNVRWADASPNWHTLNLTHIYDKPLLCQICRVCLTKTRDATQRETLQWQKQARYYRFAKVTVQSSNHPEANNRALLEKRLHRLRQCVIHSFLQSCPMF